MLCSSPANYPQKPTSFLKRILGVAPGHTTGYSYVRMRTSHKLKMQEKIASMSLTILVGGFQHARM